MAIISQTTWDKFTQEEKEKVRNHYKWLCNLPGNNENAAAIREMQNLFDREQLQPQPLSYEDVARELFKYGALQFRTTYYIKGDSNSDFREDANPTFPLNMTSQKQGEKLLAINRLLNVARFLNGKDWKPDWEKVQDREEVIFGIGLDQILNEVRVFEVNPDRISTEIVYFRTEKLAKQAIQILGEDTVRLALSSDY